jgi:hypothetical protein
MAVTSNFGVPTPDDGTGSVLMPKLQYRFRVLFDNLGGSSDGNTFVTKNVVSVTRPTLDHEDVTIDVYNSKIRLAGKHTWGDVTLIIRDDINSDVVTALGAQMASQVNHSEQSSRKAGGDYKFGMRIEMLDGSNEGDGQDAVIDAWTLAGCFIPSIQYGDLNYATSEVVQITATIRYDNASNEIGATGGDDLLSSPGAGSDNDLRIAAGGDAVA